MLRYYARWFYLLNLWMKSQSVTIQMKTAEKYFPVVMFTMLYKSLSVSMKSSSVAIVWYAVQGSSNFFHLKIYS